MTKAKPAVSTQAQLDLVVKRVDRVADACERMGGHRMPTVPFCDTASKLIDPAGPNAKRWLK